MVVNPDVKVLPGEYELIGWDSKIGPQHSNNYIELTKKTEGKLFLEIWEGAPVYDVCITTEFHRDMRHLIIAVTNPDNLEKIERG